MNWDAIGAVGEIVGAAAVVLTLGYLAIQVRFAKIATTDANRMSRGVGIREIQLAMATNDDLRRSVCKAVGLEEWHNQLADKLGVSADDAARMDYVSIYHFWMHYHQFLGANSKKDKEELHYIIGGFYRTPAIRYSWDSSPYGKASFLPDFVTFVDRILRRQDDERAQS
jgi:hypothetical protein